MPRTEARTGTGGVYTQPAWGHQHPVPALLHWVYWVSQQMHWSCLDMNKPQGAVPTCLVRRGKVLISWISAARRGPSRIQYPTLPFLLRLMAALAGNMTWLDPLTKAVRQSCSLVTPDPVFSLLFLLKALSTLTLLSLIYLFFLPSNT